MRPARAEEMRQTRAATQRRQSGEACDAAKSDRSTDDDHTHWRYRVSRSLSLDRAEFEKAWKGPAKLEPQADHWLLVLLTYATLAAVSWFTMPPTMSAKVPTVTHVWYYGWLSALSTGLGTLPLFLWSVPSSSWMGACNAIAAGMMLSASMSLVSEGCRLEPDGAELWGHQLPHVGRVAAGVISGMVFVFVSKKYLEEYEDLTIGDLKGLEAAKMLLIVGVMTLHSFAEGLGIGVSFCGANGSTLGVFISASLAVHNVPEGLAVALVLIPRGVSKFRTFVWAIFTSLPQPVIAAPVFLFVEHFIMWEPVGLGFAAGAMFWVACFELIADAVKEIPVAGAGLCMALSFSFMMVLSNLIGETVN
mmetsp:Transcript_28314/g.55210  ORF Transcript_28314/g.55210 Transcript_28314/m.55210 type:complete len:362 (+) Transcript_28314:38-1123(+)